MTLVQLKHLIELANSGSFSQSALKLHLTQPALSRSIKALEDELGQALFDRIGRKNELTPFGQHIVQRARVLVDEANELRLTLRQNILIPFVKAELLPFFYTELNKLGYAEVGYNGIFDITSCPGTDTCNLGIASSTGISRELEKVLKNEFPQLAANKEITIKISGCMNSCGQHGLAQIGFHGSSLKAAGKVVPAAQVLLGGGTLGVGLGMKF